MASSKTPRVMIGEYLDASRTHAVKLKRQQSGLVRTPEMWDAQNQQVHHVSVRTSPVRRSPATRSKSMDRSLERRLHHGSVSRHRRRSSSIAVNTEIKETPRQLIEGFFREEHSTLPIVRHKRRTSQSGVASSQPVLPVSHRPGSGRRGNITDLDMDTPRTLIRGFLQNPETTVIETPYAARDASPLSHSLDDLQSPQATYNTPSPFKASRATSSPIDRSMLQSDRKHQTPRGSHRYDLSAVVAEYREEGDEDEDFVPASPSEFVVPSPFRSPPGSDDGSSQRNQIMQDRRNRQRGKYDLTLPPDMLANMSRHAQQQQQEQISDAYSGEKVEVRRSSVSRSRSDRSLMEDSTSPLVQDRSRRPSSEVRRSSVSRSRGDRSLIEDSTSPLVQDRSRRPSSEVKIGSQRSAVDRAHILDHNDITSDVIPETQMSRSRQHSSMGGDEMSRSPGPETQMSRSHLHSSMGVDELSSSPGPETQISRSRLHSSIGVDEMSRSPGQETQMSRSHRHSSVGVDELSRSREPETQMSRSRLHSSMGVDEMSRSPGPETRLSRSHRRSSVGVDELSRSREPETQMSRSRLHSSMGGDEMSRSPGPETRLSRSHRRSSVGVDELSRSSERFAGQNMSHGRENEEEEKEEEDMEEEEDSENEETLHAVKMSSHYHAQEMVDNIPDATINFTPKVFSTQRRRNDADSPDSADDHGNTAVDGSTGELHAVTPSPRLSPDSPKGSRTSVVSHNLLPDVVASPPSASLSHTSRPSDFHSVSRSRNITPNASINKSVASLASNRSRFSTPNDLVKSGSSRTPTRHSSIKKYFTVTPQSASTPKPRLSEVGSQVIESAQISHRQVQTPAPDSPIVAGRINRRAAEADLVRTLPNNTANFSPRVASSQRNDSIHPSETEMEEEEEEEERIMDHGNDWQDEEMEVEEEPAASITSRQTSVRKSSLISKENQPVKPKAPRKPRKKENYSVPTNIVKKHFGHYTGMRVSKEAIEEVMKVSETYWDNLAVDLEAYAKHAGRKRINMDDFVLLFKRQGHITGKQTMSVLIEKYLPMEERRKLIPVARAGNRIEPK